MWILDFSPAGWHHSHGFGDLHQRRQGGVRTASWVRTEWGHRTGGGEPTLVLYAGGLVCRAMSRHVAPVCVCVFIMMCLF